jgi:hypothetical protein
MRASRQTELERQFPLHLVYAWLGNSPKVAQRSYLLVTEADFEKAVRSYSVVPTWYESSGQGETGPDWKSETPREITEFAGYSGGSGWGGIRTPGRVNPTPVFKTGALNRSATHPFRRFH